MIGQCLNPYKNFFAADYIYTYTLLNPDNLKNQLMKDNVFRVRFKKLSQKLSLDDDPDDSVGRTETPELKR